MSNYDSTSNHDSASAADAFLQRLSIARRGTPEQQAELLDSFRDYLRRLATTTLGNQQLGQLSTSDLVQSAIIEAHQWFGTCRAGSYDEFKAWLRQILINDILNRHRDLHRMKRDVRRELPFDNHQDLANEDDSPSRHTILEEDKHRLTQALSELSDEQQKVITMRQRDQLSFVEIAEQLNRTPDSIRMTWNRAIQVLAKVLVDNERGL